MKIKLLITCLLGAISVSAFAQKGELSNAQEQYEKFATMRGQKVMAAMATTAINSAKTSIDKASANEKTANLPQTYALKASIYADIANQDTVSGDQNFATADAALKKARELDTKGENKKLIDNAGRSLAQYQLTKGVKDFQSGKYDLAYKSFDYYRQIMPDDTTAIYYTGVAAANAKNYTAAIANYSKLVTTNYSNNARVYLDMSSLYLANKDTAGAAKSVSEGVAKYPSNALLAQRQIELALQTGKQEDLVNKLQAAISNDPKNKALYYYAGLTYSQIAEAAQKDLAKAKDAASKTAAQQKKTDNYTKAADMYKKALEIDPNYFEANLNMGYVIINPAIELYNAANKLPTNKQKEYEAAIAKANAQFDLAKPYLQKAVDLNPKSADALKNLKTYYLGKRDTAHANDIQKQIDALPAQ